MLSKNEDSSLLAKLDDEESKWWGYYTESLEDGNGDWELSDAATLVIAYLVESGHLTYEEVAEATKALKRCSDWDIGKACFIDRVMKDAARERGKIDNG